MNIINKYIGGNNIINSYHKVAKLQKNYNFIPLFDYAKESSTDLNTINNNVNRIQNDIHYLSSNYPDFKFSYALKLSSFGNNSKILNNLIDNMIDLNTNGNLTNIFLDSENYHNHAHEKIIFNNILSKHNMNHSIYKTYQMYKKNSLDELKHDINHFPFLNIKLVRGAYLEKNNTKVFYSNKSDVDINYNNAIKFLLCNKYNHNFNYDIMFATHNSESIELVLKLINNYNISKNNISFGQLLGFNEKMSSYLSENNFKVYKYVPYASYYQLYPYLLRRLYENYSIIKYVSIF